MAQTNMKTDDFCAYNQASAIFYNIFMPGQWSNTYVYGEVGINAAGGSAGSFVRSEVIDVSSFLSGRDDILSRCNPPVPSLDEVKQAPLKNQNSNNVNLLISKFTKEKKSAVDLGAVDYNRWQPNLPSDPQNLRFVIEDFSPQRGGMNTTNYAKLAWDPKVSKGAAVNGPRFSGKTLMDPQRACGEYCSPVNGLNANMVATPMMGKPPGQPNYPFMGPTSQQMKAVGATACAENQFYGVNYDQGSCGTMPAQQVMLNNY
jgi:hypothetical protein